MAGFGSNVELLKVHPAIGVARLSRNEDYYVFGEKPDAYKSVQDVDGESVNIIKRQAVRFFISSYTSAGAYIRDYSASEIDAMGIDAVWMSKLCNRKISEQLGRDPVYEVHGESRSDNDDGRITGRMDASAQFDFPATGIELGQLNSVGLFLPSQVSVVPRVAGSTMPAFGGLHTAEYLDGTADGAVTVELTDRASGDRIGVPVLPAWVVIAPPDFAPDQLDSEVYAHRGRENLDDWLVRQLNMPAAANVTARQFDRRVLENCTSDFAPGIEASFGRLLSAMGGNLRPLFYSSAATRGMGDIRLDPARANPGDMTYGLCSPWQYDFRACGCHFWAAQRPDTATRDDDSGIAWEDDEQTINWLRQFVAETGPDVEARRLLTNPQFVNYVERLGILREIDGEIIETERDADMPGGGV